MLAIKGTNFASDTSFDLFRTAVYICKSQRAWSHDKNASCKTRSVIMWCWLQSCDVLQLMQLSLQFLLGRHIYLWSIFDPNLRDNRFYANGQQGKECWIDPLTEYGRKFSGLLRNLTLWWHLDNALSNQRIDMGKDESIDILHNSDFSSDNHDRILANPSLRGISGTHGDRWGSASVIVRDLQPVSSLQRHCVERSCRTLTAGRVQWRM